MARDYELGIVINPDVGDEQARAIVERITQVVANNSGQVVRVNAMGRRRLAYPIERHRDGLYFFFDLILDPRSVEEIERSIRVNEDVIRHLMKLRDPRVVGQQRQREAEADAQAVTQAAEVAARAAAAAEQAAANAEQAAAAPTEETPQASPDEGGVEAASVPSAEASSDEPEAVAASSDVEA